MELYVISFILAAVGMGIVVAKIVYTELRVPFVIIRYSPKYFSSGEIRFLCKSMTSLTFLSPCILQFKEDMKLENKIRISTKSYFLDREVPIRTIGDNLLFLRHTCITGGYIIESTLYETTYVISFRSY